MSFFTSQREKRLWLWALAVVIVIYATVGLAGTAAGFLQKNDLLGVAFGLGMLLVIAVVVVLQWVKKKSGGREIWVGLGVFAAYFIAWVRIETPAERTHLIEYGVVALFIYQALLERVRNGRKVWSPPVIAVLASALLGWLDEGIQYVLPNRVYDLRDVAFNALAGFMAVMSSIVLDKVRGWGKKSTTPDQES